MPMNAWTLPKCDIKPVDELMLGTDGLLRVVPAWKLQSFPLAVLQTWCIRRGVYQYPTEELINWLSHFVNGRKAIEISAGNGAIGRALGIPITDSYMQTRPEIIAYYNALGQEPITPPKDVVKMTANEAVRIYQPEVVIGAWVTELYQEGKDDGSVEGVDEMEILKVADYVHIGNDKSHGYKESMRVKHQHNRFDWLVSRGQNQSLNHLAAWEKL